jgi:hypothetical protein
MTFPTIFFIRVCPYSSSSQDRTQPQRKGQG